MRKRDAKCSCVAVRHLLRDCRCHPSSRAAGALTSAYHMLCLQHNVACGIVKVPPIQPRWQLGMAFDAQIIHWQTISAFQAYLQGVSRPKWVKRLTNHNTYIPNEDQWRGLSSMNSMRSTYIAKGWTSGPHLYLCATAPNPSHTGIWQMTPITHPGTHAGACNADALGIESVGDFDRAPPSAEQYTLLLAINRLILQHWGIPPSSVTVHNECMTGRTCPGKYVTGTQIRASLSSPPPPPITKRYRVKRTMISQRLEGGPPYAGELAPGEEVIADKWYTTNGGTVHIQDGRGFVLLSDLEPV